MEDAAPTPEREASTVQDAAPAPDHPGQGARVHLPFLDGLRGLAALYVVFFHNITAVRYFYMPHMNPVLRAIVSPFRFGQYAVDVFIVLSGFCLMLPVAQSKSGELRGGLVNFFKRRAWRILPAYYAALAVSIVLIVASRHFGMKAKADDGDVFTPGNLLAHVLLLHDFVRAWNSSINVVLWTVAVEWQIYFVFGLLLLPLWRRLGTRAAVLTGFVLGVLPRFLLTHGHNFDWARPWYLGLFALGMAGAVAVTPGARQLPARLARVPWFLVSVFCLLAIGITEHVTVDPMENLWWKDPLIGLGMLCLLIGLTRQAQARREGSGTPLVLSLLQSRWAVALGGFSYSLYLIHVPCMWILRIALRHHPLGPGPEVAARLALGVPLILGAAYVFHLVCERPFLRGLPNRRAAERADAVVPIRSSTNA